MADQKLTDKDPIVVIAGSDLTHIVDVNDPTSDPQGTSKKATQDQLRGFYAGTITSLSNQESSAQINTATLNFSEISIDGGVGVGTTYSLAAADEVIFPQDAAVPIINTFTALPAIVPAFTDTIFIYRTAAGALLELQNPATAAARRAIVYIGQIFVNPITGTIDVFRNAQNQFFQDGNILLDNLVSIGAIVDSNLRLEEPSTAIQKFFLAAGAAVAANIGNDTLSPHSRSFAAQEPVTFQPRLRDGSVETTVYPGGSSDTPDTTVFDDGAGLVAIGGSPNQAQIFRCWIKSVDDGIVLMHGQQIFSSLNEAIQELAEATAVIPDEVTAGTVDLGGFIATNGATDFQDNTEIVYFAATAVGVGLGGPSEIPNANGIFFDNFVPGPNAPVSGGDSVEIAIEKHEQRLDDSLTTNNIIFDFKDSRFFGEKGLPNTQGWTQTEQGTATITTVSESVL